MNVGKTILGVTFAALVATAILSLSFTIYLGLTNQYGEELPGGILDFAPMIFAVVFFVGSWSGVLFTHILRHTPLSDVAAAAWSGLANGLVWSLIANVQLKFESLLPYVVFCLAGSLSGIAFWFVAYRNSEETTSLSLVAKK
jgi:hypothetical protein